MKTVVLFELKANFFRLILTKAEILGLKFQDFDFEKQTVRISRPDCRKS